MHKNIRSHCLVQHSLAYISILSDALPAPAACSYPEIRLCLDNSIGLPAAYKLMEPANCNRCIFKVSVAECSEGGLIIVYVGISVIASYSYLLRYAHTVFYQCQAELQCHIIAAAYYSLRLFYFTGYDLFRKFNSLPYPEVTVEYIFLLNGKPVLSESVPVSPDTLLGMDLALRTAEAAYPCKIMLSDKMLGKLLKAYPVMLQAAFKVFARIIESDNGYILFLKHFFQLLRKRTAVKRTEIHNSSVKRKLKYEGINIFVAFHVVSAVIIVDKMCKNDKVVPQQSRLFRYYPYHTRLIESIRICSY